MFSSVANSSLILTVPHNSWNWGHLDVGLRLHVVESPEKKLLPVWIAFRKHWSSSAAPTGLLSRNHCTVFQLVDYVQFTDIYTVRSFRVCNLLSSYKAGLCRCLFAQWMGYYKERSLIPLFVVISCMYFH